MTSESSVTQFFKAVEECDIPKVEELLISGKVIVDLVNPSFYDRTALHVAACNGNIELVRLLVDKYKAKIAIEDKRGQIPLQIATDYRNIDIVKFLLQRGSNLREYAESYLNSEEVEDLFQAAEQNNIEKVIQLITDLELDINTEDKSNWNRTVLEVAATNGYYDLVRVLVDEYDADFNHTDDLEETALIMAMNNGHENVANSLLERGATNVPEECSGDESDASMNLYLLPN